MAPIRRTRLEFWTAFGDYIGRNTHWRVPKPHQREWMSFSAGRSGFAFVAIADAVCRRQWGQGPFVRADLYISGPYAKTSYSQLIEQRDAVEREFGQALVWHNPERKQACRIFVSQPGDFRSEGEWPELFGWLHRNLQQLEMVFAPRIAGLP